MKWARIACLYFIPYRCKIEQPDTYNIMGYKFCNVNVHVEVSSLVKKYFETAFHGI